MSEPPIMLGSRYRLDEVIGRGGMAEVWRAWDTRLGRDVAIKRLRVDLATDPTFQARFQREAQSAAGLNHPNIVAVYDTGAERDAATGVDIPFIVMELVQGTTLRDLLRDGRQILPERSLEFTAGVLDALAYAHRNGIVHRDIKPGNVMLTTTGRIKVMDFGIARAVSETSATMTQTAAVIGTAQYLSPEQARGETVDARSDIYSVGCLLYELLTSRPPFIGDSPVAVAYQHVREQPIPPSQIDGELTPEMDTIVLSALEKDANTRYQNAQAMRDDIQRLLDGKQPLGAAQSMPGVDPTRILSDRLPPGARPRRGFTEVNPAPHVVGPHAAAAHDATAVEDSEDQDYIPDGVLPPGAVGAPEQPAKHVPVLAIVLAGLVVVLLTVGFIVLHNVMQPPPDSNTTMVPSVVTMLQSQAMSTIQSANLVPKVVETEGPPETKGQVIEQSPDANTVATVGTFVTITVNTGPAMNVIPDVVGKTESAARTALSAVGFTNVQATTVTPGTIDEPIDYVAGQVLSVEPDVGTTATLDTPVTLNLATGKSPVPQLVGMSQDQAIAYAKEKGFEVSANPLQTDACQPNYVCSQTPDPNTYELRTNKIFIQVATAPPVVTPPTDTETDTSGGSGGSGGDGTEPGTYNYPTPTDTGNGPG